jgi:amino acid transporter
VVLLAVCAALLIYVFNANTNALIQLYVIGVFIAFTLSQIGMVKHWHTELATGGADVGQRRRMRRAQVINATGAVATGLVFVIVLVTKFLDGAYLIVTIDEEESTALRQGWDTADLDIPLKIIESPYREITRPILKYVRDYPRAGPRDVITVIILEYVVGHWWETVAACAARVCVWSAVL